jgi:hypothetical protein
VRRDLLRRGVGRRIGWRIRLDATFYGPDDRVLFWYGRDGYLGHRIQTFGLAIDETGTPIGTVEILQTERLVELDLNANP